MLDGPTTAAGLKPRKNKRERMEQVVLIYPSLAATKYCAALFPAKQVADAA